MGELLGTRALARALGVSAPVVTKAARDGRIQPAKVLNGRALFDLDAVRQIWSPAGAEPPPVDDGEFTDGTEPTDVQRYNTARADREEALAAQEKLELARMQGDLLPRGEVALAFTSFLRVASQAVSGLPAKTLSRHPGLTPAGRDFLAGELRTILDDLAAWKPGKE